jgi:hypothetical protein
MMQKAVADRIHTLVGDVVPSKAVVSQVSALLADHSQRYDTSGKPRSDLFVVDANPNILVFDLLTTYSLLHILGKHGSPLPLVAELALALFLTNGNDKLYHTFRHLEGLATLPKDNLTMYFANWCNSALEMFSPRVVSSNFILLPRSLMVCPWRYPIVWWSTTLCFQQMMMVSPSVNPWTYSRNMPTG